MGALEQEVTMFFLELTAEVQARTLAGQVEGLSKKVELSLLGCQEQKLVLSIRRSKYILRSVRKLLQKKQFWQQALAVY